MADMLEKLLGVEKGAASLITDAEAEVARKTAQARMDAQKESASALKEKAAEMERSVIAEKASLAAERAAKTAAYRESLAKRAPDEQAFRRAALGFIDKGAT